MELPRLLLSKTLETDLVVECVAGGCYVFYFCVSFIPYGLPTNCDH